MQSPSKLMRYMRHCHRREWLESTLSLIVDDKLPNIVTLLNERHKHMLKLMGG